MNPTWRLSPWSGAAIGVVAAAVLTWLTRESWQVVVSIGQQGGSADVARGGWFLLAVGVVVGLVVVGSSLHRLISAVPALWLLVLFGPTLVGLFPAPDWYPDWVASYVLGAWSPAPYIIIGVLVVATFASYVRNRMSLSEFRIADREEAHP